MPAELSPEFEAIMATVRGKVSPYRTAAISAILYSEELRYDPRKSIIKMGDAQSMLEAERRDVANRSGFKLEEHVQHTVIQ